MNILSAPLINYVILFSFLIFFFRIVISNLYKKEIEILNLFRIVQH